MSEPTTAPVPDQVPSDERVVDPIPEWVRQWVRRLPSRVTRVDVWALAIAMSSLILQLWLVAGGSFYIDDFRAQTYATDVPYWPFVVESNGTHLSPGARSLDWIQAHYFPLDHGFAVLVTLLVRVLLLAGFWRAARLMFGPRQLLLVPLTVLAFTPALVPPTGWYRQAITAMVCAVAICWCTDQHVRYLRSRRVRNVVGAVAGLALGLSFYEKSLLIVPWLVLLTLLFYSWGEGFRPGVRSMSAALPAWVGYALVSACYLYAYASGPFDSGSGAVALTPGLILRGLRLNLLEALLPGLMGGPLKWEHPSPYYGYPNPPTVLVVLAAACFVALVGGSVVRSPSRALRAWALLAVMYGLSFAVIAVGRMQRIGSAAGLEFRVWTDVVVLLLFCSLLAVLPIRGRPRARRRSTAGVRSSSALTLATVCVVVLAVVSTVHYGSEWHRNPSDDYVSTLATQIRDHAGTGLASVLPTSPPQNVMPGWVEPGYDTYDLLAPLHLPMTPYAVNRGTRVPDDGGNLTPVRYSTAGAAAPGPATYCGWSHAPGAVEPLIIPMADRVPYYRDSGALIGVLVGAPTGLHVQFQVGNQVIEPDERAPLTITKAGPYELFVRLPPDAAITGIRIMPDSREAGLCVPRAPVVVPEPRTVSESAR